jgi:hypothetical protein
MTLEFMDCSIGMNDLHCGFRAIRNCSSSRGRLCGLRYHPMAERAGGLPQETLGLAQNFFWRGSLVGRSDPQVRRTPPIQVNPERFSE